MSHFVVYKQVCKTLLLGLSGAKVVHLGYKKIGKWLIINHLPIFKSDPFGARTQDPNIKSVVLYRLS